ncbi:MAG: hypothetical protein ABJA74_06540 [Lapillicoccus sp.]
MLPFLCAALGGSLFVAGLLVPLGTIGTLVGYTLGPTVLATRLPSRAVMALMSTATAALLFALSTISLLLPDRGLGVNMTFVGVALGTGVTSGVGSIAFTDVLARGVHPQQRSRLLLTHAAVGGAWPAWWPSSRPGFSRAATRSSGTSRWSGSRADSSSSRPSARCSWLGGDR